MFVCLFVCLCVTARPWVGRTYVCATAPSIWFFFPYGYGREWSKKTSLRPLRQKKKWGAMISKLAYRRLRLCSVFSVTLLWAQWSCAFYRREWSKKTSLRNRRPKKIFWKKIHMDGAVAQTYVRPTLGRAVTNKHTNKQTFLTDPAPLRLKIPVIIHSPRPPGPARGSVIKEHKFCLCW